MPDNITYAVGNSVEEGTSNLPYAVKQHDDDVIFSKESLEEFIRLIQRQGINNLTVYAVSDLLAGSPPKYQTLTARFAPPTFENPPQEFEFDELKDRKGYFVFVRYSFCWEGDSNNGEGPAGKYGVINDRKFTEDANGEYHSLNEINGRHVFVKTINDIRYYVKYLDAAQTQIDTDESAIFKVDLSDENPLPDVFTLMQQTNPNTGDPWYQTNGTFLTTVDNIQYLIKIRGFNDAGEYIGKMKIDPDSGEQGSDGNSLANNTDGYVLRGDGVWANAIDNNWLPVNNNTSDLGSATVAWRNLYLSGNALPQTGAAVGNNNGSDLGASNKRWKKLWVKDGDFSGAVNIAGATTIGGNTTIGSSGSPVTVTINGRALEISRLPSTTSDTAHFWRGDGNWADSLTGTLSLTSAVNGRKHTDNTQPSSSNALFYANGNGRFEGNLGANKVFKAVFNDYAEFRSTIDLTPGHCVVDNDDGSLSCTTKRLMPGTQVISDTFGDAMGYTEKCQTPLAVAGRVLVYTYQPRENYHAGMAVCSAPDGTVDIMTREEIRDYPDCIVGIVSEIPQYEKWGTEEVNVDGRIWIKVK